MVLSTEEKFMEKTGMFTALLVLTAKLGRLFESFFFNVLEIQIYQSRVSQGLHSLKAFEH